MLQFDHNKRPTANQCLSHPWFNACKAEYQKRIEAWTAEQQQTSSLKPPTSQGRRGSWCCDSGSGVVVVVFKRVVERPGSLVCLITAGASVSWALPSWWAARCPLRLAASRSLGHPIARLHRNQKVSHLLRRDTKTARTSTVVGDPQRVSPAAVPQKLQCRHS